MSFWPVMLSVQKRMRTSIIFSPYLAMRVLGVVSSLMWCVVFMVVVLDGLTKKAEPPPTRDVNRDSGTASANGGWLRRLVEPSRFAADLAEVPRALSKHGLG